MSDGSSLQPLPALALDGAAASSSSAQAPGLTQAPLSPTPLPPAARGGALPIVAIVLSSLALAVSTLALVLLLVLGGLTYLFGGAPLVVGDPGGGYSSMFTPGTVTDAGGAVVTGVGTYDRPAVLGEHTLSWPTEAGGTVAVTVTAVDWEADAAVAADPSNTPASPGAGYVLVTVDLAYTGPGHLVPAADLYLCLESMSWMTCGDEVDAVTAAPLWDIGALADGDEATAIVPLELAEGERGSAVLSVETIDGEPLYLAES